MRATSRRGFRADIEFYLAAELPGGALEIALVHYAIDRRLLDRWGASIGSAEATQEAFTHLVRRLVGQANVRRHTRKSLAHLLSEERGERHAVVFGVNIWKKLSRFSDS